MIIDFFSLSWEKLPYLLAFIYLILYVVVFFDALILFWHLRNTNAWHVFFTFQIRSKDSRNITAN